MKLPQEHSISVGISHVGDDFFLKFKVKGKLNHSDYVKMLPMVENALVGIKEPKIRVLIDAREFEGLELRAVWDDLKFGLKHNKEFTKLAFVGDKSWEAYGIRVSNWFMSSDMKYFEDIDNAILWLNQKEARGKKMDVVEKEFKSRENEIKKELKFLFKANMRITGWDIPEPDNHKAAILLQQILQDGLDEIKEDIKSGKFD